MDADPLAVLRSVPGFDAVLAGLLLDVTALRPRTVTASCDAGQEMVILCDATAGPIVVTLPRPDGNAGRQYYVKKTDASANTVTVSPGAIVNLATNPSGEVDATGWTGVVGSVARSADVAAKGSYSLAVTLTSYAYDGAYHTLTLTPLTEYTVSVAVLAPAGLTCFVQMTDSAGTNLGGVYGQFTGTGALQFVQLTTTTTAGTSYRVYVQKNNKADTGTLYVDALQVEAGATAHGYVDGDQSGCAWSGTAHGSTSFGPLLDGEASVELALQYFRVQAVCDGIGWHIL